jgi:hypothetical protein
MGWCRCLQFENSRAGLVRRLCVRGGVLGGHKALVMMYGRHGGSFNAPDVAIGAHIFVHFF